jgi:hypothetical protein
VRKDGGQLTCNAVNGIPLVGGEIITPLSPQVRLPGSPLAYRIFCTLIADSKLKKKVRNVWKKICFFIITR